MGETVKDIWDKVDVDDQREVNISLKNTMMIIAPAIEQMWKVNMKVNILYGVLFFGGIIAAIVKFVTK
jgi:hypothetical protein